MSLDYNFWKFDFDFTWRVARSAVTCVTFLFLQSFKNSSKVVNFLEPRWFNILIPKSSASKQFFSCVFLMICYQVKMEELKAQQTNHTSTVEVHKGSYKDLLKHHEKLKVDNERALKQNGLMKAQVIVG